MGKIADRIAKTAQMRAVLFSDRMSQPTKVDRTTSAAIATRLKRRTDLWRAIAVAKTLDTGRRHDEMCRLADLAKAWGFKGRFGELCNRTQCLAPGATWYNRGSYAFYCADCARMLNHDNRHDSFCKDAPLCREVTEAEVATLHVSP